ncbi:LamG-like jellyroll fold domain-containing protein [Ferruginibacter sp. SUN106]|uniref:LamG-like jellyroll fold domain-containing protein n=1 Tax=Ferruginibacter sp. SUN106 TaxID=2978348 RepID=UPI003D369D32
MKKFLLLGSTLLLSLSIMAQTPVAYYPFSGNANDAIGTLNGTVNGASLTTDRFGNANSAYSFDGVNDAISFTALPMNNTDNFTLIAWVNPALFDPANQFNKMIISLGPGNNGYNMGMGNNSGSGSGNELGGLYNLVTWLHSGSFFSTVNTWYHVALVRENGVTKFYMNAVLAPNTNSSTPFAPTTAFQIGGQDFDPAHYWNGKIDEVKIYNVALTAVQIQQEYATSSQIQKPGSGNAISFDGFDDGIEVTHNTVLNFPGNLTVDTWIKIAPTQNNAINPDNSIIEKWGGSSGSIGYPFVIRFYKATHSVGFARYNGVSSAGVDGVTIVDDNKWHHVAAVKNGTTLSLYIDGVLQGTVTDLADLTNINNTQSLNIGTRGPIAVTPNNITGSIDEIRIWNVGMTQAEIRDRMCHKITSADALYSNLVAYYNFDESTGTTVFDGSTNANNGAMANNPARVTSGAAIGNASSHDYVNAIKTTTISHATGESFTVTSSSGNPDGIQVYRVDEQPNTLTGATGVGSNDKYFGVFQVGGTSPQYTAVYNYTGNPGVNIGNENQLRLNKRTDNAATTWSMLTDIPNEAANTITVTGESTEYILGKLGAPLPLNLISFTGAKQNGTVQLNWTTNNEINTAQFVIERSNGKVAFAAIGTVQPLNISTGGNYKLSDNTAFVNDAVQYYRLKIIDNNGRFVYSNIIRLSNGSTIGVTVFPNPAKVAIAISSSKKQDAVIINTAGQVINKIQLLNGSQIINVANWPSGIYFIKTEAEVIKLIKE